ncbi:MAG: metallo-beta-lactamase family protein [Paraglaciecola sp.]|jgi:metallo-beta-lactamase family protein
MKIQFCGAARAVTGSAHLITLENGYKILLDCGLYQGNDKEMKDFNDNWLFTPADVNCLVLSHAHIDHTGRVPKLVKDGFSGGIHSTHATRSLSSIMLLDSAKIQERDAEYYNRKQKKRGKGGELREALYSSEDVTKTMGMFQGYGYDKWFNIHPDVKVQFRDAGHILGSASVTLQIFENGKTHWVGFTGDIGRPNRPILRDPQPMPEVDFLICESTYGDKEHESAPNESNRFLEIIKDTCLKKKGKLIIPAFSIGRTQEIVYMLDQMETAGVLPKIPVYVDSPLAVNATAIFGSHPECYDNQLHEYLLLDPNPFGFNDLQYVRDVEISKSLNDSNEPCIIISSSGMMNAGRVRHHLANNIANKKNTFLIVGYCAPHTPGGMLKNGIKEIKLYGEVKPVLADIEEMDSFSAHADRAEIASVISNQKGRAKKIFLVHGEIKRQTSFQGYLGSKGFEDVEIPELGEEVEI